MNIDSIYPCFTGTYAASPASWTLVPLGYKRPQGEVQGAYRVMVQKARVTEHQRQEVSHDKNGRFPVFASIRQSKTDMPMYLCPTTSWTPQKVIIRLTLWIFPLGGVRHSLWCVLFRLTTPNSCRKLSGRSRAVRATCGGTIRHKTESSVLGCMRIWIVNRLAICN